MDDNATLSFRVVSEYKPRNRITGQQMACQKTVGLLDGKRMKGNYYFVHCPHGKTAGPYHSTVYAHRMVSAPWLFCNECEKIKNDR